MERDFIYPKQMSITAWQHETICLLKNMFASFQYETFLLTRRHNNARKVKKLQQQNIVTVDQYTSFGVC